MKHYIILNKYIAKSISLREKSHNTGIFPPQLRYGNKGGFIPSRHLIRALRAHLLLKEKACVTGTFIPISIPSRQRNTYREAPQSFLRRTTPRYNIPSSGINGFNAVKARWDGIERIQEVSESPAQLDFAALQSFSTHATKPHADAPNQNQKPHKNKQP